MVKDEVPFTHGSVGVWVCGCMYIGYTAKAHVHG